MVNKQNKLDDELLSSVMGGIGINEFQALVDDFRYRGDSARREVEVLYEGQWVKGTIISAYSSPMPRQKAIEAKYTVIIPGIGQKSFEEYGDAFNLRFL